MNHRTNAVATAALALSCVLAACSSKSTLFGTRTAERPKEPRRVIIDGQFNEWPTDVVALADSEYVYFRVNPGAEVNLPAMQEPLVLLLDLDASTETGSSSLAPRAVQKMGVDLEVTFSPAAAEGEPGFGVEVRPVSRSGPGDAVSHADIDLGVAPTHSSEWFEIRVSRAIDGVDAAIESMDGGAARGVFVLRDTSGQTVGWADPFAFDLPPAVGARTVATLDIPNKPAGGFRVVSYNVWRSAPMENPGPFARVLRSLDPDVILLQEWDEEPAVIESWFTAQISGDHQWTVQESDTWGVTVVSKYPMREFAIDRIVLPGDDDNRLVRLTSGVVQSPVGDVAVGSLHLKCCGSVGTPEDERRTAEAEAIAAALRTAIEEQESILAFVLGGDMNLVGSRGPLEIITSGTDLDGSDLAVAEPYVLGDTAQYTWLNESSAFSSSRLDYLMYSDATANMVRTFTLDTRRLSERALEDAGLTSSDCAASDHLPVVIDIQFE